MQAEEKHLRPQAISRCWNGILDAYLKEMGFMQSTSDPCIYMDAGGDGFCIRVYVDDMVLAGRSDERIKEVKDALSQRFDIKNLRKLHHFLGVTVEQDEENGRVWIGQSTYTRTLLEKFGMQDCRSVSTPVDVNSNTGPNVEFPTHSYIHERCMAFQLLKIWCVTYTKYEMST